MKSSRLRVDAWVRGWFAPARLSKALLGYGPHAHHRLRFEPLEQRQLLSTLATLASFDDSNGEWPQSGLIEDRSGNLFGVTAGGGANGDGVVFELKAGTGAITAITSFNGANGEWPSGTLVEDSAGDLFGTTYAGGTNNDGTVFEIEAGSDAVTTLASFNGANGSAPRAGLIKDSAGNLFGTTSSGGGGGGTVFEVKSGSNAITTIVSFNGANGSDPWGGLIEDSNGNLFGTTYSGGADEDGTAFEIKMGSNAVTTLASFYPASGYSPEARLVEDANGNLFGTTSWGGMGPNSDDGTVFEIKAGSNSVTPIVYFTGANGVCPWGGLVEDSSGNLFGTTVYGGSSGDGTVFEVNVGSHVLTTLISFNNTTGLWPYGGLVEDISGDLFGTTYDRVSGAYGTVFKVSATATATTLSSSQASVTYGTPVTFTAAVTAQTGSATPTAGTVDFYDTTTSNDLGDGTLGSSTGTTSTWTLTTGAKAFNVTTGDTITATYSPGTGFLTSSGTATEAVTPLGISGNVTASNKVYDGTTAATINSFGLTGVLGSDTVSLTGGTAAFASPSAANGITVTATGLSLTGAQAGDYSLSNPTETATANITPLAINGSVTASNKTYDGTTAATISSYSLTGVLGSDAVSLIGGTATFAGKNVGTSLTVTASGLSLAGTQAGDYSLLNPTEITTANITARAITVTAATNTKIYDGTVWAASTPTITAGSVAIGDTAAFAETYDTSGVGTGKTLTPAGSVNDGNGGANYAVSFVANTTGAILARPNDPYVSLTNGVPPGFTGAEGDWVQIPVRIDNLQDTSGNVGLTEAKVQLGFSTTASIASGGATENGNTVTITTQAAHNFVAGESVTITGAGQKGYNGTFYIQSVPTSTTFTYTDSQAGLPVADGGTARASFFDEGTVQKTNSSSDFANTAPIVVAGPLVPAVGWTFNVSGGGGTVTIAASSSKGSYDITTTDPTAGGASPQGDILAYIFFHVIQEADWGPEPPTSTVPINVVDANTLLVEDTVSARVTNNYKYPVLGPDQNAAVQLVSDGTSPVAQLSVGSIASARGGATYSVPVMLTPIAPGGPGVAAADADILFDPNYIDPNSISVSPGNLQAGSWETSFNVDTSGNYGQDGNPPGVDTAAISLHALISNSSIVANLASNSTGSLWVIQFTTMPGVSGSTVLNLVPDAMPAIYAATNVADFYSQYTLSPAPTVGDTDPVDGLITFAPWVGTTTALTSTGASVVYGTPVTFTATVSAPSGSTAPAAGSVDFNDMTTGQDLGSGTFVGSSGLTSTWTLATGVKTVQATAGDTITATYAAGGEFLGSSGTTTQAVTARPITVAAVPNTKPYDGTTSAAATPEIVAGSLVAGDTAAFTESYDTPAVGVGKTLTPAGSVADGHGGDDYAVTFNVNTSGAITAGTLTTTTLRTSQASAVYGTVITFTASVSAQNGATPPSPGSVDFFDTTTGRDLGAGSFAGSLGATSAWTLAAGVKAFRVTAGDTVTASYSGELDFGGSTGTVLQAITARAITVTAAASTKIYDGTISSTAVPTITAGSLVAGDTAAFSESYDTPAVGTDKTLTPTGSVADGNGGNNYAMSFVASATGAISSPGNPYVNVSNGIANDFTGGEGAWVQIPVRVDNLLDSEGHTGLQFAAVQLSFSATASIAAGGATENGNTVTITTKAPSNFVVGESVTITKSGQKGYNGNFYIQSVPNSTTFTYADPVAGLPTADGGTALASFFDEGPVQTANAPSDFSNVAPIVLPGPLLPSNWTFTVGGGGGTVTIAANSVQLAYGITTTDPTAGGTLPDGDILAYVFLHVVSYSPWASSPPVFTLPINVVDANTLLVAANFITYPTRGPDLDAAAQVVSSGMAPIAQLSVGSIASARGGATYTVPVVLTPSAPGGPGIVAASADILFDPNYIDPNSITVTSGNLLTGSWQTDYSVDTSGRYSQDGTPPGADTAAIAMSASGGTSPIDNVASNSTGSLWVIQFTTMPGVSGPTVLNLVPDALPAIKVATRVRDGVGSYPCYTLSPAPTKGDMDPVDGTITLLAGTTTTVTSSVASVAYGTPVSFTAAVCAQAGTAAPTAGSVDFYDTTTATDLGWGVFDNSTGTTSTWTLATIAKTLNVTSADTITAIYTAGSGFVGSSGTTTQTVTALPLTVSGITAADKPYDGGFTAALLGLQTASLVGVLPGDTVTLGTSGAVGTFASNSAAQNITVSVTGLTISDAQAEDYTLTQPIMTTANITPLGIHGNIAAANKIYDSGTLATIAVRSLSGVLGSDAVSLSGGMAAFANRNVGSGITVTATGLTLAGAQAGDYSLVNPTETTTANITPLGIIGSITASDKVYDRGTTAAIASRTLSGVLGSDAVSLSGGTAAFADASVANGITVTATGLTLTGAQAGEYSLLNPTETTAANIAPRPLTVAAAGVNKLYDGGTTATVVLSDNHLAGDNVTDNYTSANFSSAGPGTGIAVAVNGISISGADAGNYSLQDTTTTTSADIGTAEVIDDSAGAPGFAATGTWTNWTNQGYDGDLDSAAPLSAANGLATATWTFNNLAPDMDYKVAATWTKNANRASNAPFTISGGPATLPVAVNEQPAPAGMSAEDGTWQELGVCKTTAAGTLVVSLSNSGANGYVIADAVMIEAAPSNAPAIMLQAGMGLASDPVVVPSLAGGVQPAVSFGTVVAGAAGSTKTFTVSNGGGQPLTIATLSVPAGFTLLSSPSASVPPGGSTQFVLRQSTAAVGTISGTVTLATNDSAEGSFSFQVTGTVTDVAPTATLGSNGPVYEGTPVTVSFANPSDTVGADAKAGFRYSFAFTEAALSRNYAATGLMPSATYTLTVPGTYTMWGRILDVNNAYTDYSTQVTVKTTAVIIDDSAGAPGFAAAGPWTHWTNQGYQGDVYSAPQASTGGLATATWTFSNLNPSQSYAVETTWTKNANRAANAPFTITGGTVPGGAANVTVQVDQRLAPVGVTGDGGTWQVLSSLYQATSGTLTVTLTNSGANGYVIADAVRLQPVSEVPPTAAISNSGPVNAGSPGTVSLSNAHDPVSTDAQAGFHYSFAFSESTLSNAYVAAGSI